MSNFVYLGAEVPSNRIILEQMGVTRMGVSVWGLIRRGLPKTKTYLLENYFPEGVEIYVYPGMPANKTFTAAEMEEFLADYEDFIANNLNRITMFTEVDHPSLDPELKNQQRASAWSEVPEEKFAVIYDNGKLESLATRYLNVCIPSKALEDDLSLEPFAKRFAQQHGTTFHGLGIAKPDSMRNTPFKTMSTLAWLSPMMRGETIVWHGNKITRYPKSMKDQARPRYKAVYEQAGLDFDKILADDAVEVSKLAIWSYQQLEAWNNRAGLDLVTMSDGNLPADNAETPPVDVAKRGADMRKLEPRNPDEMRTLPSLGVEVSRVIDTDSDGVQTIKDVPVIKSNQTSLRMCNTCIVAPNCPAAKPDSACAFNLPVEVKTKAQLKSLIDALVEMQGQRVAFAKFAEDLNGGYPDPNVSQELDRFFKILKTIKELDDSREMMRVTVERSGSAGVLSSLFGDKAKVVTELPNGGMDKDQTDNLIQRIDPDKS